MDIATLDKIQVSSKVIYRFNDLALKNIGNLTLRQWNPGNIKAVGLFILIEYENDFEIYEPVLNLDPQKRYGL